MKPGKMQFWMKLCDILKNHPFLIPVHPDEVSNHICTSQCVGKNPILMEESPFFQKNQLFACEALRSPILAPFSTVLGESSITGHSKTRFAPNAATGLVSNVKKCNLHGWPPKFRNNLVGGSARATRMDFWMSLCDILKNHCFFFPTHPKALEILKLLHFLLQKIQFWWLEHTNFGKSGFSCRRGSL